MSKAKTIWDKSMSSRKKIFFDSKHDRMTAECGAGLKGLSGTPTCRSTSTQCAG